MCARSWQVFARSSKFSLFDPAKEMVSPKLKLKRLRLAGLTSDESTTTTGHLVCARHLLRSLLLDVTGSMVSQVYIEMSKEEKSKGKAAVDLVGSQIGKSGASWITQALLLITGSIQVQTLPAGIMRPRAVVHDTSFPEGSP